MQSSSTPKTLNLQSLFDVLNQLQLSVYRQNKQSESADKYSNQNKIFLIFGAATSGKTVVQYYLCQKELQFGVEEKKKLPFMLPVKQYLDAQVIKFSNSVTTRCPNVLTVCEPQSESNNVVFVEIPDFKELQDEQKLCWHFFLQKTLKNFNKIHLVLILTQQIFDDGGALYQNLQCFTSIFDLQNSQIQQKLLAHFSIIINKTDPRSDEADVQQKLEDITKECIQSQNERLANIIINSMSEQRVYVIKQEQPEKSGQKELLENILEKGECGDFTSVELKVDGIKDLIPENDGVDEAVEKVDFVSRWVEGCLQLFIVSKYLSNNKKRQGNSKEVQMIIQGKIHHFTNQLTDDQQNNISTITFQGKLPAKIKAVLKQLVKTLKNQKVTQSQESSSIKIFKNLIQRLKLLSLQQLGIFIKDQTREVSQEVKNESTNQKPQTDAKPQQQTQSNRVFYRLLTMICNDLSNTIQYMSQILDYQQDSDIKNKNYIQFNKPSLKSYIEIMVNNFKDQFRQFNLSWLSSKIKSSKPAKRLARKKQYVLVPGCTQADLKKSVLQAHKSKSLESLINTIISFPNNHFKLDMLCSQLSNDLQNIQTFIQRNFLVYLNILKEISDVLKTGKLYFDQLKFLILIPDWNAIEQVIDIVKKYEKDILIQDQQKEKLQFLNKLGVYARVQKRKLLSEKILNFVDEVRNKIIEQNTFFEVESMDELRLQPEQITEKIFLLQALELYNSDTEGNIKIVEIFKVQQERIPDAIEQTNQFLYLISHKDL